MSEPTHASLLTLQLVAKCQRIGCETLLLLELLLIPRICRGLKMPGSQWIGRRLESWPKTLAYLRQAGLTSSGKNRVYNEGASTVLQAVVVPREEAPGKVGVPF